MCFFFACAIRLFFSNMLLVVEKHSVKIIVLNILALFKKSTTQALATIREFQAHIIVCHCS